MNLINRFRLKKCFLPLDENKFSTTASKVTLLASDFSLVTVADSGASASRVTGPAPFAVHFEGTLYESSASETRFGDQLHGWNFDDPDGNSVWNDDQGSFAESKNIAYGPVVAHIFETPGTYDVLHSVFDDTGLIQQKTITITVTDPDDDYPTTSTVCIRNTGGSFTGAPAGSTQVTTDSWSTVMSYVDTDTRVLIERGSSFSSSTREAPNGTDGQYLGTYGSGAKPIITYTGSDSGQFLNYDNMLNALVMGLDIRSTTQSGPCFGADPGTQQLTLFDNDVSGFSTSLSCTDGVQTNGDYTDQIYVFGNYFTDHSSHGVWCGGERICFVGNTIQDTSGSHTVRIYYSYKGVFLYNNISGAASGMHCLKFHGPRQSYITSNPQAGNQHMRYHTSYTNIHRNIFGGGGTWMVGIGPQNGVTDERLFDIIFDGNLISEEAGFQSPQGSTLGLLIWANYVYCRNNVIDLSNGQDANSTFIRADVRGINGSTKQGAQDNKHVGIQIYNNTFYRKDNAGNKIRRGIHIYQSGIEGCKVYNNYMSLPNNTSTTYMVVDDGTSSDVDSSNLYEGNQTNLADPDNATVTSRDYSITGGTAVNGGTTVPVYRDHELNERTGTMDIGAFHA